MTTIYNTKIQVFWGAEWIEPKSFEILDEATVKCFVERYDGQMTWCRFRNRKHGHKSWRYKRIESVLKEVET